MATASPPGYSRLFATGLFLSTETPLSTTAPAPSRSRSTTPTPITTPMHELQPVGSATLAVPSASLSSRSHSPRRPKLAALRTHSAQSAGSGSSSVPPSPRVVRRRRSSVTLAHNPITGIKSPTRSAGISGRMMQALGSTSPGKERSRGWPLEVVGERNPRPRRAVVARKPPPTAPLPALPNQPFSLPTLTLNTSFSSPLMLSPALTPSPNILPALTPGAMDLGLHRFSFANHAQSKLAAPRSARSPLVSVAELNTGPGYFDVPLMRGSSPVLPENENRMEVE